MNKLVEIENLNYSVQSNSILNKGEEKVILKNISLVVGTNEIVGITGESGSGKTTLIKLIAGILKPSSGEIKFAPLKEWKNIKTNPVQILFQNNNEILNPFRKIEDIVEEAVRLRNKDKINTNSEMEKIFKSVGFTDELRKRKGFELSGGEQQRAALSRILAAKPELLILDEPFSANLTMICVAHNLKILRKLADRIIVMYNGEIVERGSTEEIFNSPKNDYTKFLLKCENYNLKYEDLRFKTNLTE